MASKARARPPAGAATQAIAKVKASDICKRMAMRQVELSAEELTAAMRLFRVEGKS